MDKEEEDEEEEQELMFSQFYPQQRAVDGGKAAYGEPLPILISKNVSHA